MFNDDFKSRYTTIPFATFSRDHRKDDVKQNMTTLLHNHKEIELMAVLDGRAEMCIDSKSYEIKKGDIVIVSPYMMHNTTFFANFDFRHYCVCFDLSIIPDKKLKENLEKGLYEIKGVITGQENVSGELSEHIKKAFEAHEAKCDGWELKVIGNLSLIFGYLAENKYIFKNKGAVITESISYRIIDYIEKNYTKKITSADAAEAFYVSKSYFCRIFKKNFGHCFQNYLCMYRIEKSKTLLKTTNIPISDIALQVGFNSFSFYSKMFKNYMNISPSEYRKEKL